jgi:hypothetical protein
LAVELAELAGLQGEDVEEAFYLGLLHSIGCTADAPVTPQAFGDDVAHKAAYTLIDPGRSVEVVTYLWRNVYPAAPRPQRLRAFVPALAAGREFARVNLRRGTSRHTVAHGNPRINPSPLRPSVRRDRTARDWTPEGLLVGGK